MTRPLVGSRRPAPRSVLIPGLGSAFAYLAALVILSVVLLALRAAFVERLAPVVSR